MPIAARHLGTLPVSAASGLCLLGDRLWVVADDERDLVATTWPGLTPAARLRLPGPPLPADAAARKRAKPDHEALVDVPGAGLLALGSGSTPARHGGALVDAGGGAVRALDLAPLHAALAVTWPELNLEGAVVAGDELWLLQRGNGPRGANGVAALDLAAVRGALAAGAPWTAALLRRTWAVDLGELAGARLGFTDGATLPDGRIVFSAAAERSPDTYHDGACTGSALGVLAPDGRSVSSLEPLAGTLKVEGVAVEGGARLLLCVDADDPAIPAALLAAELPARR